MIEWFERLGDVPGITWQPRAEADSRLIGARPVVREKRVEGDSGIGWVDAQGQPLADEWVWRDSPVTLAIEGYFEAPAERRLRLALAALEVPGTRADFSEALGYAQQAVEQQARPDYTLLESLLSAHVQLVLADPSGVVGERRQLDRAGQPLALLLNLYQREGFLREAAGVERLLSSLPAEMRPRYLAEPGPAALIDALEELR
ncbi:MAG: hypothetical protein E6G34_02735 [Actinobacteria bacterium]|nr:MAG: hypothetical protein E6G34_02735 [Actinomycetota bacterium]